MKHQTPNTKHQIVSKPQTAIQSSYEFDDWCLMFLRNLVFGFWCLIRSNPFA